MTPYAYCCSRPGAPRSTSSRRSASTSISSTPRATSIMPVESPAIPIDASTGEAPVPAVREAASHRRRSTSAGEGRQADPRGQGRRTRTCSRPRSDPRCRAAGLRGHKIDDQGVSVSKFDPDGETRTPIISERTWLVTMQRPRRPAEAARGLPLPEPQGRRPPSTVFQRYVDADLAKVWPQKSRSKSDTSNRAMRGSGGSAAGCLRWRSESSRSASSGPDPGEPLPRVSRCRTSSLRSQCWACSAIFNRTTVCPPPPLQELAGSIDSIEKHYFAESDGQSVDLKRVAETWVQRVS